MENKKDLLNTFRMLFDDNINIPCNKVALTALCSEATGENSSANYPDDVIATIEMGQWDHSIHEKTKRMLSFDSNNSVFQDCLAKIFNIPSKTKTAPPVKNIRQDDHPKKRPINIIENKMEHKDEQIPKTEFKTASGKTWDPSTEQNVGNKISTSAVSSSYSSGSARRNLGLSKPASTGPTAQMSSKTTTTGFKPSLSIQKDAVQAPLNDLPEIKGIEPKMVELILNEILDKSAPVDWDDVAGLEFAKNTIKEIIIWPMLRPDIFKGLRGPPKGVLLFGPPGTGKTLIGKCIASKSKATFFSISASSLTSKWVGEGEKMVRSLFAVAKHYQPAVIFIDEIDSLLTQRCDGEHESSRRIKTEFLVQLDGCGCFEEERILVIGATNRPQELDEAARRRLVKKLYIPLPEAPARKHIIDRLLQDQHCSITTDEIQVVVDKTEGYSGADVTNLCKEAAIAPLRSVMSDICTLDVNDVPPIALKHFESALQLVKSSVSPADLHIYRKWNDMYDFIEFNPPKMLPQGNVGTPLEFFKQNISSCRMPVNVLKRLGICSSLSMGRSTNIYGKVSLDYEETFGEVKSAIVEQNNNYNDNESNYSSSRNSNFNFLRQSPDTERDVEEWDRYEALHDDVDEQQRSKPRLYEQPMEVVWEKGGSGLVFHTDGVTWKELEGKMDFDEDTADDWDVDTEIYSTNKSNTNELLERTSEGQLVKLKIMQQLKKGVPQTRLEQPSSFKISKFATTQMRKYGWKRGESLGKNNTGIKSAITPNFRRPDDKSGLGIQLEDNDYDEVALNNYLVMKKQNKPKNHFIATIYDQKTTDCDKSTPWKSAEPTYMKYNPTDKN